MNEALILVASAVIAGVVSAVTTWWRMRTERAQRTQDRIDEVLEQFREPLISAAFDLQSRLYNIVLMRFVETYVRERDDYVVFSTEWLIGQYFAWTEILRQKVQFLDFGAAEQNLQLVRLQQKVAAAFATDRGGRARPLQMFRANQRGIGELMIDKTDQTQWSSLGYAAFVESKERNTRLATWMDSLRVEGLSDPNERSRAIRIQRALIDLIDFLDEDRSRYPLDLRGKLPVGSPLPPQGATRLATQDAQSFVVARFRFTEEPWSHADLWAAFCGWSERDPSDGFGHSRAYEREPGLMATGGSVEVSWEQHRHTSWVTIDARALRPRLSLGRRSPRSLISLKRLQPRSQRLRVDELNVLLRMFDRPVLKR